ncbi:MAG: hypothetical protein WBE76_02385 [Terracidiphilus sp.]
MNTMLKMVALLGMALVSVSALQAQQNAGQNAEPARPGSIN